MISLTRCYHFEAAHRLTGLRDDHPCMRLHGHNYKVEVEVSPTAEKTPAVSVYPASLESKTGWSELFATNGMVVEAGDLDRMVGPVIRDLDHRDLNEIAAQAEAGSPQKMLAQPTAENIAMFLVARLCFLDNGGRHTLIRLRVTEVEGIWAEWRADRGERVA